MNKIDSKSPSILTVDDDQVNLRLIERILLDNDFNVVTASSSNDALLTLKEFKPDLILLDVMMPEMNGYELCSELQKNQETAYIPVVFVTSLGEDQDKAKAFAVGGTDYLVKPINRDTLVKIVNKQLQTRSDWNNLSEEIYSRDSIQSSDFIQFKNFLGKKLSLSLDKRERLYHTKISEIYSITNYVNLSISEVAQLIAEFSGLTYFPKINPECIKLGKLPPPFCRKNNVVAIEDGSGKDTFVITNPFDWELLDLLKSSFNNQDFDVVITNPNAISSLFSDEGSEMDEILSTEYREEQILTIGTGFSESDIAKHPIIAIANSLVESAVSERASDIHIEPKEGETVVRFRVDGDMREMFTINNKTSVMLLSRLKVLANMDIAEKRKPQDGAFAVTVRNKAYNLRLATTSTVHGESLIIRLLDPYAKAKDMKALGMTEAQSRVLNDLAYRKQGLILIVGPTGSGKTTTIHSLLHNIDYINRSIISIEDPVEYRMPFINQQEVNKITGVTFESLLKSVVRQDPDVLFLGEIRDQFSARTAMNFASTGHLSITTLHTSNATTAIFRLERLEVDRGTMADSLIGIIAQRLLKKLCPDCKKIMPISKEYEKMLSPFTDEIPQKIAEPVGCPRCSNSGYRGREGVYEIIEFDTEISKMVRSNTPVPEIRSSIQKRGDYLISNHAIEKVKNLIFPPKDIYEHILVEETNLQEPTGTGVAPTAVSPEKEEDDEKKGRILVVEDDKTTRALINHLLEKGGYIVTLAEDGIDALMHLGKTQFDLILSDVDMPNLDGFKLLEMRNQKGFETPVIFMTSRDSSEDEKKGFELGATDYIFKPIRKETLLLRIKNAIERNKRSV